MGTVDVEITIKRRERRSRPQEEQPENAPSIPRISRLMALAIKFQDMVDRGEVHDYADLARLGFVTRARLTQIMNLVLLAPAIQEDLLLLPKIKVGGDLFNERNVRSLTAFVDWDRQSRLWQELVDNPDIAKGHR